ncbi:hypothetical protein [Cytobacillus sp. AMY 15.2]|uniref:hypothetical protein n=1 Tax=Cytobacillus sp. AMY 15.2 TaxID=2939563 RepID=UPI00203C8104|nr:hypothetical protein [Cytobacillus sp. AMY 15.2]
MSIFHKADKEPQTDQYKSAEKETGQDLMYLTKKMFVAENIIGSRRRYVPVRITENYLVRYLENIKKDKNGPMIIRTERQKTH